MFHPITCPLRELAGSKKACEASNERLAALEASLAEGTRQNELLKDRFYTLASNHEEMIKFKDGYKEEAMRLRGEVRGLEENKRASEVEEKVRASELEKNKRASELEEKVREMEGRVSKAKGERMRVEGEREIAKKRVEELEKLQVLVEQQKQQHLGLTSDGQFS